MQKKSLLTSVVAACAGLLAVAGAACGQCTISRPNMPDFDQLRATNCMPVVNGLPNHGQMYCAPTSMVNVMAYLANNGYPALMGGNQNWQNADYNFVNTRLRDMGTAMSTSATGGTQLPGWYNGTARWLQSRAPNKFTLIAWAAFGSYAPSPNEFYRVMRAGGLVTFSFGYYVFVPQFNAYVRTGGHVVTLIGVNDACGPTPAVRIHDPVDNACRLPNGMPDDACIAANWCNQSNFVTFRAECRPVFATFAGGGPPRTRTQWQLTNYAANGASCFIDGYVAVFPKKALTVMPENNLAPQHALRVISPTTVVGDPVPTVQDYPTPGNVPIVGVSIFPGLDTYIVATGADASHSAVLWAFDAFEGGYTPLSPLSNPGPMTFNRNGELLISNAGMLQSLNVLTQPPTVLGQRAPLHSVDGMVIDGQHNQLLVLSVADSVLTRYDLPLGNGSAAVDLPLPNGVQLAGRPSFTVSPVDGTMWVTSSGSTAIYQLLIDANGVLTQGQTAAHETIVNPVGLDIDSLGHLVFASNSTLREISYDPGTNQWVTTPGSDLEGKRGDVTIALSEDNQSEGDLPLDDDYNILPPEDNVGTPECRADFNNDGVVNSIDFFDFLACFLGGGCPRFRSGDFNSDGAVTSQDFFDFIVVFFNGCS